MIQIGDKASPDFSDPLGMLEACHQRMLDLCLLLERMCDYQDQQGIDRAMIESAGKVIRYFDIAAPHHHADEEKNLFPRLSDLAALQGLLERLTEEHSHHDALWENLKPCLLLIQSGQNCPALKEKSKAFVLAYRAHIRLENEQILPRAQKYLTEEILNEIGQAMAMRRSPG